MLTTTQEEKPPRNSKEFFDLKINETIPYATKMQSQTHRPSKLHAMLIEKEKQLVMAAQMGHSLLEENRRYKILLEEVNENLNAVVLKLDDVELEKVALQNKCIMQESQHMEELGRSEEKWTLLYEEYDSMRQKWSQLQSQWCELELEHEATCLERSQLLSAVSQYQQSAQRQLQLERRLGEYEKEMTQLQITNNKICHEMEILEQDKEAKLQQAKKELFQKEQELEKLKSLLFQSVRKEKLSERLLAKKVKEAEALQLERDHIFKLYEQAQNQIQMLEMDYSLALSFSYSSQMMFSFEWGAIGLAQATEVFHPRYKSPLIVLKTCQRRKTLN